MIVTFAQDYLRELYESGKDDKKHRFRKDIIKRYKKGVDYLKKARRIEDLFPIVSLNYKVLSGDKAGLSSIRVNDQYRIEFEVEKLAEPVVTICNITDLSKHYES